MSKQAEYIQLKAGDILNFNFRGSKESLTLPIGRYILECWGAQGGYRSSATYGGKGGYSKGTITLTEKTPIYVYVGGSGNSGGSNGGFNGGGSRSNYPGGGGGSDIRIGTDSLYARVIVAGGGGSDGASNKNGMYGGGSSGGSASQNYGQGGGGGTQTSGGSGNEGSFGQGGVGKYQSSGYAGAGGGGWYGGGGSTPDSSGDDDRGGGGGSGYVYTASSASNYPNGCLLNSSLYLTDTQLSAGNQSFLAPNGVNETGHSGDGYCRITVIECKTNIPVFCKVDSQIKLVQSMWFKFNNKLYKVGNDSYNLGDIMNYQYSGNSQTVQLQPGIYKLECWGAQGGTYSSYRGGAGGYSSGIINITEPTTLYINVGGQPSTNTSTGSSQGGFNGGGNGCCRYYSGVYTYGQGGGGATDIRIGSNSLYARVIVAGGGGGSASQDDFSLKYGGGTSGGSTSGYVGTQTSGGSNGSFGQGGAATTSGTNYKYGSGGGGGGWYGGGAYNNYSDSDSGLRSYNGGGSGYVYTANTSSNYPSGCTLAPKYYLTNASTIAGNQSMPAIEGANETGHSGHGHCRITKVNLKRYGMFIKQNNTWNYIQF